jgi:alpha-ketoglutarate-dependent taurine dioxygenase
MNITPIHEEFGVLISGIDLAQTLDERTFAQIDDAINRYSLVLAIR